MIFCQIKKCIIKTRVRLRDITINLILSLLVLREIKFSSLKSVFFKKLLIYFINDYFGQKIKVLVANFLIF